jgi:DNA-binding NarL/FixJ family response regulator
MCLVMCLVKMSESDLQDLMSFVHQARRPHKNKIQRVHSDKVPEGLTKRQFDVLQLVVAGYSNKQISQALVITDRVAKFHVSGLMQIFNVQSRAGVAVKALKLGIVDMPDEIV